MTNIKTIIEAQVTQGAHRSSYLEGILGILDAQKIMPDKLTLDLKPPCYGSSDDDADVPGYTRMCIEAYYGNKRIVYSEVGLANENVAEQLAAEYRFQLMAKTTLPSLICSITTETDTTPSSRGV